MLRRFVILSGTSITPRSETARSAKEAMELVLQLMKLRRPGVRIETAEGEPLSFFQLKELVASEGRKRECLGVWSSAGACEPFRKARLRWSRNPSAEAARAVMGNADALRAMQREDAPTRGPTIH
jgi:hypothetical protein